MQYKILRFEKYKNHEGEIINIFLAVLVVDGEERIVYEHWLNEEEKVSVLANESNLKPILEECYAQAELKLEKEIDNRPQPTEFVLETEGKKEILEALVNIEDIEKKKSKILSDKIEEIDAV